MSKINTCKNCANSSGENLYVQHLNCNAIETGDLKEGGASIYTPHGSKAWLIVSYDFSCLKFKSKDAS